MADPHNEPSVEDLALLARSGHASAVDALIRRIQPDVMRRCGKRLPCRSDAEEACNDALLQVARHISDFQGRSKFTTWLHPIVERCILQTYRSLKRRSLERPDAEIPDQQPGPSNARVSVLAGTRIEALEAMEHLRQYNPDLLEPLMLRDLADLTYEEIAERLAMPLTTTKSRVMTGRKIIQAYLRHRRSDEQAV